MTTCSKLSDTQNYIYPPGGHFDPQCWISGLRCLEFLVVFHPKGLIWGYSHVIHPDGAMGTYPGLVHDTVQDCATSVKSNTLNTLPSPGHPPPPLIHIHLIFTNILLSAYSINPSVTVPSFDQISMCFHWHFRRHISCPQWPTLTSPVSSPRAWSLPGVLLQLVSKNGKNNIYHQFSSCSPPVFFWAFLKHFILNG